MGSVKDLEIVKKPERDKMGIGRFHFSDRYSVFDWGEMPDHIFGKGAALCIVGAYCFERLEEKGIKTHYRGLVDSSGKVISFDELNMPTNIMEISLVNVYKPKTCVHEGKLYYDYSIFSPSLSNFLIPLEIIYRNGLPEGSSIFKRLERGLLSLEELGLDHFPRPNERLQRPIFDISTKLEEFDRYISWKEAKKMVSLSDDEVEDMKHILLKVNDTITEMASRASLENEDGKIELAFDPSRSLMVVDVVGTLDECRFTFDGLPISKEILRKWYRHTEWYRDVEEAKRISQERGIRDWKKLCKSNPPKLDEELRKIIRDMYLSAANTLVNRKIFDAPSLPEVIKRYLAFEGEMGASF
ncbi:MAG: phosphoribosylaminoimidazolesuccinocarboxamide synthase [Candidatus Bathyarchaeia archaeon]